MARKEFEMSTDQLQKLLYSMQPQPAIMLQCGPLSSGQERANNAWCELGNEMGFDGMTVKPVVGKGERFFTAEEVDNAQL